MDEWPQPNEHGVFLPAQCENMNYEGNHGEHASISVIQTGPDQWIASNHINFRDCGTGGYPSTGSKKFPNKDAAIQYEVQYLEKYCTQAKDVHSRIEQADHILKWLKTFQQWRLF